MTSIEDPELELVDEDELPEGEEEEDEGEEEEEKVEEEDAEDTSVISVELLLRARFEVLATASISDLPPSEEVEL